MKENNVKIIFHIDMNAFFCAVACILDPSLRGIPFAIGREGTYKGVLSTASYEARKLGIHSAMPIIEAYKILPTLLVVNSNYEEYYSHINVMALGGITSIQYLFAFLKGEINKVIDGLPFMAPIKQGFIDTFGEDNGLKMYEVFRGFIIDIAKEDDQSFVILGHKK